jgi:hypothetical protein
VSRFGIAVLAVLLACTPVKGQQVMYSAEHSTQPQNRLGVDLLRWTYHHADALNLQGWRIVVVFDSLPVGTVARTKLNPIYRLGYVVYDLRQLEKEGEAWRVTLHEMLHIRLHETVSMIQYFLGSDSLAIRGAMNVLESLVVDLSMAQVWEKPR